MPALHPAELKSTREYLGLSDTRLAKYLAATSTRTVSARTVRNWEEGKYPIPDGVLGQLAALEEFTGAFVAERAKSLSDVPSPVFETYRSDAECPAEVHLGAAWHRAAAARIARAVPGCTLAYALDPVALPDVGETMWLQLADTLHGVFIDDAVRADPRQFLRGEIEDLQDDATGETAYPELLAQARDWTRGQATAVLNEYQDRYRNGSN